MCRATNTYSANVGRHVYSGWDVSMWKFIGRMSPPAVHVPSGLNQLCVFTDDQFEEIAAENIIIRGV